MRILAHSIRLVLAFLFTWAAIMKIRDPRAFQDAVASYHLLPRLPAAIVTVWMPWLELTLAGALWMPRVGRIAAGLLAALCALFLVALLQAWIRGIDITCGCFGDSSVVSGVAYLPYVARDLGLVLMAVLLWHLDKRAAPAKAGAAPDNP
jgi:putative oxidoreductase